MQITPAHDPNDFEVGKRHNLDFINIFTDDGQINSNGGPEFVGMPRFKAREAVTAALQTKVLLLHRLDWFATGRYEMKKLFLSYLLTRTICCLLKTQQKDNSRKGQRVNLYQCFG